MSAVDCIARMEEEGCKRAGGPHYLTVRYRRVMKMFRAVRDNLFQQKR